jgi:hypothetical protein
MSRSESTAALTQSTAMVRRLDLAKAEWIGPLLAVAGVAVTILPRLRWINIYEDQGVLSGMAMQTAAGQVPYRDFDVSVAPGSILLYAAYYRLFGATVVHQRLLTAAAMLIGVWLVAHIGQRLLNTWWAFGVALLWGVWLPVFQEFSPYHFWSVTFMLAMAAALLAARSARRPRLAFALAGLAASGALLMLQASVPAVVAGLVVALMVERRISRSLVPMVIAIAIPGVVMLSTLLLLGALPSFINDTILYNFRTFGPSQALPFPWQPGLLHDTAFWEASVGALWAIPMHWLLAVVAPFIVAIYTVVALWRRRGSAEAIPGWLLVGILAIGLWASTVLVHMSDQNLWLSAPLTLLLVARWLQHTLGNVSSSRVIAVAAAVPIALIYLGGLSPLILGYAVVCHTDGTGFLREVATPSGSLCVTYDSAPTVDAVVRFNSAHSSSAIAFLPTAPALYEVTGRVPPVPDIIVIPGVTTPAQLAKVEGALQSGPVEWVIYYKIDFRKDLPADTALQSASPWPIDDYLNSAYQREDQDGLVVYHLKR